MLSGGLIKPKKRGSSNITASSHSSVASPSKISIKKENKQTRESVWFGMRCGETKIQALGDVTTYQKRIVKLEEEILWNLHELDRKKNSPEK